LDPWLEKLQTGERGWQSCWEGEKLFLNCKLLRRWQTVLNCKLLRRWQTVFELKAVEKAAINCFWNLLIYIFCLLFYNNLCFYIFFTPTKTIATPWTTLAIFTKKFRSFQTIFMI
jgi:hypothetical protein